MSTRWSDWARILAAITLAGGLLLAAVPGQAARARSSGGDYTFEYSTTCSTAGLTQSAGGDYLIAGQAIMEGVAGQTASSAAYVLEPVVGVSPSGDASVTDWMLY